MSEKFTPGPWNVAGFDSRINEERYFGIGTPCGQMIVESFGECDSDRKANATLIAAAPEMYEALKKLKVCIEDYFGKTEREFLKCCDKDVDVFFIQPYMAACNALKKARGE